MDLIGQDLDYLHREQIYWYTLYYLYLYNCNLCYGGGAIVPPFVNPENCLAILLVYSKIWS